MRSHFYSLFAVSAVALATFGCGAPAANQAANNTAAINSNNPLEIKTPAPEVTSNNAPTLTPVFKAYCAAVVKKDEAAIRKAYSADTLKNMEGQMKADGVKTFAKFLELDKVTNELCEVRNEKIDGDSAVAEVRTEGYKTGVKIVFVKEGGEWKMTNKRPSGSIQ